MTRKSPSFRSRPSCSLQGHQQQTLPRKHFPGSRAPDPSRIQTVERQPEATLFLIHDGTDVDDPLVNPVRWDKVPANKAERIFYAHL